MLPSHLTLAQRKALSPRLHFFEATQGQQTLLNFLNAGDGPDFVQLWDSVSYLSKRGFSDPPSSADSPDNVPLDQFLQKLDQDLSVTLVPLFGAKQNSLAIHLAQGLSKGLRSVSCSTCTGGKAVCDGTDDDPIVANGGVCILPLKITFALALEVTTTYYRHYSSLFRRLRPPTAYLSTAHDRFPAECTSRIGGVTFYHDHSGQRVSEVKLTLSVSDLDLETYLSIPYVLFHEAVCHVFAFLALKTSKRQEAEPENAFAEGWMDFLSMQIITEFLAGDGPAAPLLKNVRFPRDFHTYAQMLHTARSRVTPAILVKAHSKGEAAVALGVNTAVKVHTFLRRLLSNPSAVDQAFFELSLSLNLHAFPAKGLEFFVTRLNGMLEEPGFPVPPAYTETAASLFSNYLKHKNIMRFFEEVMHANIRLTNE